ncbi:trafficking particle complex subunit 5-like [Paramuricea clavata]|uniref:Trafficking protein particle complex subunit 5 n=1 Tax=Paramuricea clavata TaxID=317549 RepID=A0A6S7J4I5_PARCT|nr:trafficking particle complex subunit 5-like [Paramuricea clavata]
MDKFDGTVRINKKTTNILERPLNKGRNEVHISSFALLFSEIVQYSQNRVTTVADLQTKLSDMGKSIGSRMLDVLVLREKGYKRETRIINVLLFIKTTVWKSLFGKEADKLEQSNDDDKTYYIIEKEPLVNKFISRQKDKGGLNCAYFIAGIVEEILFGCNFHCKVTAHWHKGTTFMIQFDESVIARDKAFDAR